MSDPNVTYPQTFLPSRLAAGEDYATVGQILACDDLKQATLHIPHWRIDGKPAAIRVRALSLTERDRVQKEDDIVTQYCLTWQLGCVAPSFTADQAAGLADKNPHAVEQGARFIWLLAALDQDWIDHVVTTNTAAPAVEAPADREPGTDSDAHPPARRMDRPSRLKVRPAARIDRADAR
jgi:hypothetical protein